MACERCDGNGGDALSGRRCPQCGDTGTGGPDGYAGGGDWMARRAVTGGVPRLSRSGRILLIGGVGLTALALVVSAAAMYGDDTPSNASDDSGSRFDPGTIGGAPQRIEPSVEPSRSASDRPSPGEGGDGGQSPKPPPNGKRPAYSAWAGPGCDGGGRYEEEGRFRDGFAGWYTVNVGGHKGDGCDGRFTSIPMSGSATKDTDGTATWSWYVGSGYTTCSVAVVVPKGGRDEDVAGDPTFYKVLADPDDPGSLIKTFQVDQVALRDRGAIIQKIPVRGQQLTVQLVDRGVDFGAGREGAHHAAAQMRADCTA
ncbi:adhesin [Streptomyces sp. NPDC051098]|uniref:adhesin n=2 Tax=unclassified Streptomyces TaxID=2593676 RepID=UPI003413733F